jgi:hypothetical protein
MPRQPRERKIARRPLLVESLERREVLAGNITASVVGDTLMLTGDNLDNSAVVISLGGGQYAVAGNNTTTVNGSTNNFVTNRAVSHISANMNGGNDALSLGNNAAAIDTLAGDLNQRSVLAVPNVTTLQSRISAATSVTSFSLGGNLTFLGGAGNDLLAVVGTIGRTVTANLGSSLSTGLNAIGIDASATASRGAVGGAVSVVGGEQADSVLLRDIAVNGVLSAVLGGGANSVDLINASVRAGMSVIGGGGVDSVEIDSSSVARVMTLLLGNGANALTVEDSDLSNVVVTTGSGIDTLNFTNTDIHTGMTINTGEGADVVSLNAVDIDGFFTAFLGGGNDRLTGVNSRAKMAVLNGGLGSDQLSLDAATVAAIDHLFRVLFES